MTKHISIGQTKRFLERWSSDPAFKKLIVDAPEQAVKKYHLDFHPQEIRLLWDRAYALTNKPEQIPSAVQEYREFINRKIAHRNLLREESTSIDARINAWRKRQIMRCYSQLGPEKHGSIVHAPFAVELSKGCSVGCWFCGYSAPKLSALYRYTDANRKIWRQTLETLHEVWGDNAKYGFCYWATEPLDNPDYENFICDFKDILNYFPQTTTAVPLRDIARTQRLLNLSRQKKGFVERFSIHSLQILEEVFKAFSADELKWVELITQNEESDLVLANSGKILEGDDQRKQQVVINDSTIACVSGFLLNMIDRSVQLVTPCISSRRWPKGYIIYDEAFFVDASELKSVLNRMIEKHMTIGLERDQLAVFRTDLEIRPEPEGFALFRRQKNGNPGMTHPVLNSPSRIVHQQLGELGRLIAEGNRTAGELARHFLEKDYIAPAETFNCLNVLLSFGLLKEGPD